MKGKALILALIFYLLSTISINAEETSPVDRLDQISDEALQMVKSSRYEDAKRMLEYFSEQFVEFRSKERPLTMDELRTITVAHNEAVEATTSATMNHDERINRVTKFRLVMDAITSNHEPLWTELEGPIMTVFSQVREAANNGDDENFHSSLNSFLSLYEVIYPSMKLDLEAEKVQQLDARVNYIDQYRPDILSNSSNQQELAALETDLQDIFDDVTEDDADPSLWWVIISTGSIIIVTLSYVGWRKYKGNQDTETRKRKQKD